MTRLTNRLMLLVVLCFEASPLATVSAQVGPPPAPPLCEANSPDPQRQPGSGFCLSAAEQNGRAVLVWGYPTDSENFLGSYTALNPLIPPGTGDDTYDFEGFNIYQYPTSEFDDGARELITTYDVINGITVVRDERYDPIEGINQQYTAARGTDSGIQYHHEIGGLTNYTDYYYGVSAYAYIGNDFAVGARIIESTPSHISVRPSRIDASNGGSFVTGARRAAIPAERIEGGGAHILGVTIVDPTAVQNAVYTVRFYEFEALDGDTLTTYDILRGSEVIVNGAEAYEATGALLGGPLPSNTIDSVASQDIVVDGLQFFITVPDPNSGVPAFDIDRFPDFSGNDVIYHSYPSGGFVDIDPDRDGVIRTGGGIIEVSGTPCPDTNDYGCATYDGLGNTVWHDANPSGDYYMTAGGSPGTIARLMRYIESLPPEHYEMRFTEAGGFGVYGFEDAPYAIAAVPFELWNVGLTPDDPSDDSRMIPFLNVNTADAFVTDWANQFTGSDVWSGSPCPGGCPVTEWVYYMMPDRPDGYDLFHQAAVGFGGAGALYDPSADGDEQVDQDPFLGGDCANQGNYVDYCYRNQDFGLNSGSSAFIYPIGRTQIADLASDGTTPPVGTVIRFLSSPPRSAIAPGDVFTFDTAIFALVTGDAATAEAALDLIAIVPNPYMGQSAYETGNMSRAARFTNLPEVITIRVYTVSGTLVKTLSKDDPRRSMDWDLRTDNDLPIASGMYLIHVDVPGVGERVLKFGVVQRRTRITVF